VYVPESESNSVAVIDPNTMKVVDRFQVGRKPQHVTPSWDLKTLWVDDNGGNDLIPIDPKTGKPGDRVRVTDPYNVYFRPDGRYAIVVNERYRALTFRDPHSWEPKHRVEMPCRGPNHADFDVSGTQMLVSCEFSGQVVLVDVKRFRVLKSAVVGGQPVDVKLAPDGSMFYVADQRRGGVMVVDPHTLAQKEFIRTGRGTHGFVVSRSGKSLYVTNRGAGTVSVIRFATRKVASTWQTGGSPDMGGLSSDGNQLWLSGLYNSVVYVIDTRFGRVIARIPVKRGPHGVCLFPQPGRYSTGHVGSYR
jgi:YVTN family beta-propeller protein